MLFYIRAFLPVCTASSRKRRGSAPADSLQSLCCICEHLANIRGCSLVTGRLMADWRQWNSRAHYTSSTGSLFLHSPFSFLYIAHLGGPWLRTSKGTSWLQLPLFTIVAKVAVLSLTGMPSHPVVEEGETVTQWWRGLKLGRANFGVHQHQLFSKGCVLMKHLQNSIKLDMQCVLLGSEMLGA